MIFFLYSRSSHLPSQTDGIFAIARLNVLAVLSQKLDCDTASVGVNSLEAVTKTVKFTHQGLHSFVFFQVLFAFSKKLFFESGDFIL